MKEKEREKKKKDRIAEERSVGEKKQKDGEQVPNDYHSLSPIYDPPQKEDALPICSSKMKLALDPNYYQQNYMPKQEDAPTIVNNLVAPPAKTKEEEEDQREDPKEENKGELTHE